MTDLQYEAGDQNLWASIYGNLPAYVRKNYNFNMIKPITNTVAGDQIMNRKQTIVVPREHGDQITADQFTKLLSYYANKEDIYGTISEAFHHGSLITGMSLLQVYIDYRNDPISGDIKVRHRPFNSFIMDPYWTRTDLSDCNGIILRDFLSKQTLISMYPEFTEQIMAIQSNQNGNARDNKFQYAPQNYDYGLTNLIIYDQYYYRDFRQQKFYVDTRTGQMTPVRNDKADVISHVLSKEPQLDVLESSVPTVKLACFIQDKCVYDGPNPLGIDTYGVVPMIGYHRPEIPYYEWRIQGLVRSMRDPQFLFNRFVINMADTVESQVNSGWKYKENALVNPADVFMQGNGKGLALKEEAQMSDAEKIQPSEASATAFKLSDIFNQMLSKVSGISEEAQGMNIDDKSGLLAMVRQAAGKKGMAVLFENLDKAQKLLGNLILELIQVNIMPGKIAQILKEEPAPQFYNKAFGKYDCVIEEGTLTATQKQLELIQLLNLKAAGLNIPDKSIMRASTIQNKAELMKEVDEANQQKQQMEQAQAQVAMQEQQAKIELANAHAVANRGLGIERASRVQENKALAEERRAKAISDLDLGTLNLVKAAKEFHSIDLQDLQSILSMHSKIREQERIDSEPTPQEENVMAQSSAQNMSPASQNSSGA